MDHLQQAAKTYAGLLRKDYAYELETGARLLVYFMPEFFHHLMGLQKLTDIPAVIKSRSNHPRHIFRNVLNGRIALEDIRRSAYFNEVAPRLLHFEQINRLAAFEKVIVDFDSALISSKIIKADYILFKPSNDGMFLNLFLKPDNAHASKHIPLTFIPCPTDYYTYGQKVVPIKSIHVLDRQTKG